MATYGSFPGVKVQTVSGGITSVQIGAEEKLVLFGEADYNDDGADTEADTLSGTASANSPEQINARREANDKFTDGSELAEAMKEALANGANIDFLYGVAVDRINTVGESITGSSSSTGTLNNFPVYEDPDLIDFDNALTVEFRYDGQPSTDGGYGTAPDDTIFINPLTGEYAVTSGTVNTAPTTIDYKYMDYSSAFGASDVKAVVTEDETGIYVALSDADTVSVDLQSEVSSLRTNYQMVNALSVAEPNDSEVFEDATTRAGADARYDTSTYSSANQSVVEEYYYKFAPGRLENSTATIMGGIGGLFAGNAINDPIYNEALSGYSALEQVLNKTDADNLRAEDIIPVRDSGTVRVKGNRSTAFSEVDTVAADFWVRRITDRVILIGKTVGDAIIGRINDEDTRAAAERQIRSEMRDLVDRRLIRSNDEADDGSLNWAVDVYEDSTNDDEVNIDISFTPYGIVKRVDETITVNTN